jgi:hypothetical protein
VIAHIKVLCDCCVSDLRRCFLCSIKINIGNGDAGAFPNKALRKATANAAR